MEEGAEERSCYELISTLTPHQGGGAGAGNKALKLRVRKKGVGERSCTIFLALFLTTQIYFKCLKINFLKIKCVLPMIVISHISACVYLNPKAFSSYFFPSSCLGEVVSEQLVGKLNLIQG